MFRLVAQKNQIQTIEKEPMTSGSVKVYEVEFEFSEYWDGFDKIAVFATSTERIEMALTEDNLCYVPWEVVVEPGVEVLCGVYGLQDDRVLPTIWTSLGNVLVGVLRGDQSTDPTPNIYAQILDELKKKGDTLKLVHMSRSEKSMLGLLSGETLLSEVELDLGGSNLTDVYRYKGSVPSIEDLPSNGMEVGDVWDVGNGMNYAWTGEFWDALGMTLAIDPIPEDTINSILKEVTGYDTRRTSHRNRKA